MGYRYNTMSFGKKKDRIKVVHFRKPEANGFAGMITSRLFRHNIALIVHKKADEDQDYLFACLASAKNNGTFMVMMDENVFYGIKRNNIMARTCLFHELGHYYHNHLENGLADMEAYELERIDHASQGAVMQQEVEADEFAARYLGRDYVVAGLKMLITEMQQYKEDAETSENLKIAIEELNKRIEIIES